MVVNNVTVRATPTYYCATRNQRYAAVQLHLIVDHYHVQVLTKWPWHCQVSSDVCGFLLQLLLERLPYSHHWQEQCLIIHLLTVGENMWLFLSIKFMIF